MIKVGKNQVNKINVNVTSSIEHDGYSASLAGIESKKYIGNMANVFKADFSYNLIKKICMLPILGIICSFGAIVDTDNNIATDSTDLGDIDTDRTTLGDLNSYVVNSVTGRLYDIIKAYIDSKEFRFLQYYIVTNTLIDAIDTGMDTNEIDAYGGMAFDLYYTNSLYFVDSDSVPTLKFFSPTRRYQYFGNNLSVVEIGDSNQILKTTNLQVDDSIAVKDLSSIKFMNTLDRYSDYGLATVTTLQDFLDPLATFTPTAVAKMAQTNHGDIVANTLSVDNGTTLKDVTVYGNASVSGNTTLSSITITKDTTISNMVAYGNLTIPSFSYFTAQHDSIVQNPDGTTTIVPTTSGMGIPMTLSAYIQHLVEPVIAFTNEVIGFESVDISSIHPKKVRLTVDDILARWFTIDGENRRAYLYDAARIDSTSFSRSSSTWTGIKSNFVVRLPDPAGSSRTVGGITTTTKETLDFRIIFDLSAVAHNVYFNIGILNFAACGENDGLWKTVYSTEAPESRVESVYRETTSTTYDLVYNETTLAWEYDYENPHTVTTGYYDEYTMNMVWEIAAGECKEFIFKQSGTDSMSVEVRTSYKTQPE